MQYILQSLYYIIYFNVISNIVSKNVIRFRLEKLLLADNTGEIFYYYCYIKKDNMLGEK